MSTSGLQRLRRIGLAIALALGFAADATALAAPALTANELAVIVNENDSLSILVADYYRKRRGIPAENVVRVRIPTGPTLSRNDFTRMRNEVEARLAQNGRAKTVQAYALSWTQPFRVECMSITSAMAFGFDPLYCATGCVQTPHSAYFDSDTRAPYTDLKLRPAMSLAAANFEHARELIDRGVAADGSMPKGSAYLLQTSDRPRNARVPTFSSARLLANDRVSVQLVQSDALSDKRDVLFYFTGSKSVERLDTNRFLPGALADHLTSSGGVLMGSSQMSALRWLEAGATASYGTVVEPCAFPEKFPSVPIVMKHYLAGETAIEAYWKSVVMPSQGVFIGEPLAAPYRR